MPFLTSVSQGLFACYVVIALAAFFPVDSLDPNWKLRLISNLVNNAALPLVGLLFLIVAAEAAEPLNQQAQKLRRVVLRLRMAGVAAAVGFILLAGLQLSVSYAFLQQSDAVHLGQNQQLQQQFVTLRTAISTSEDRQQLSRAANLLLPPEKRASLGELPIARQKILLLQQLATNDQRARRNLDRQRSQRLAALVVDGLRNFLLCLIFGWSFYSLRPRISLRAWINAPED